MIDRNKLLELLGSEEMADKAISIFLSSAPGMLSSLQTQIEAGDLHAASRTAHGLKSQVAYLGLDRAEDLAREIEYSAEAGEPSDQLRSLADELAREVRDHL